MARFDVTEAALAQGTDAVGVRALLSYEVERARQLFIDTARRCRPCKLRGRLRWELKLTWNGGWRILEKIENAHYDVFRHRPVLTKFDAALLALRLVLPR